MDNTDEMQRLKDRGLLPDNFNRLIETLGLDDVTDEAMAEVRQVIGLTEGQNLCNRLIAKLLGAVTLAHVEAQALLNQTQADLHAQQVGRGPEAHRDDAAWQAFLEEKRLAAEEFAELTIAEQVILEDEFDKRQLEPAAANETPPSDIDPEQPPIEGEQPPAPPEATTPPKPDPLDHDGDGEKGGSKKGAQSTRAKGAANKKKAAAKKRAAAKPKAASTQA